MLSTLHMVHLLFMFLFALVNARLNCDANGDCFPPGITVDETSCTNAQIQALRATNKNIEPFLEAARSDLLATSSTIFDAFFFLGEKRTVARAVTRLLKIVRGESTSITIGCDDPAGICPHASGYMLDGGYRNGRIAPGINEPIAPKEFPDLKKNLCVLTMSDSLAHLFLSHLFHQTSHLRSLQRNRYTCHLERSNDHIASRAASHVLPHRA